MRTRSTSSPASAARCRRSCPTRSALPVERLVATGASQSAFYLTTYVNAVDRETGVRRLPAARPGGRGAPITGWDPNAINPTATDAGSRWERLVGRDRIREDVRVPVIVVQSETDVFGALGLPPGPPARRRPLPALGGRRRVALRHVLPLSLAARRRARFPSRTSPGCSRESEPTASRSSAPINSGPQMHYVLQRAVDALDRWIRGVDEPPRAARLEVDGDGPRGRRASGSRAAASARRGSTRRWPCCPDSGRRLHSRTSSGRRRAHRRPAPRSLPGGPRPVRRPVLGPRPVLRSTPGSSSPWTRWRSTRSVRARGRAGRSSGASSRSIAL